MADLEEHALKRDKRFLIRLALSLCVGLAGGLVLFAQMTRRSTGSCIAQTVDTLAPPGAQDGSADAGAQDPKQQ